MNTGIIEKTGVKRIGNYLGHTGGNFAGAVFAVNGSAPTIRTPSGGNTQPIIVVASRGRYNPDGTTSQRLEPNMTGSTNTLTNVEKDNLILDGDLRLRRLTEREEWRLMGFTDDQFDRAKASGTSATQLYKQAGNSIVVPVLMGIFENMNLKKRERED